jgi:predicted phosphodiesterase
MQEQGHRHHRRHHGRHFANQPAETFGQEMTLQQQPIERAAQIFRPLPAPTGPAPYHLSLESVIPPDQVGRMRSAGRMVFHTVGDTGGVKSPQPQIIVMDHMEQDFNDPDPLNHPAFFYHLGDVVYYYGEAEHYYSQFYEPAIHYPAPILAIPGNHDGDVFDESVPSLAAFVENFCAPEPHHTKEAGDALRDAMTQPNVYWTLEAPFVTFIGLYSNVPEGGQFDNEQITWFESEMAQAPADKALIVSVHHSVYSADTHHSGSRYVGEILDQTITKTKRMPDLVLTGHVHNYQRFTRKLNGASIPYIVAGSGGYWHLHEVIRQDNGEKIVPPFFISDMEVTLESYCDDRHGYLRMEVTPEAITGTYFTVPRPQEAWSAPAQQLDTFTIDLKTHQVRSA